MSEIIDLPIAEGVSWAEPHNVFAEIPIPSRFPPNVLPDRLQAALSTIASSMGTELGPVASAALCTLSAVIPDSKQVKITDTWRESARIWVMLVGGVSTSKSPIMSAIVGPLQDWDRCEYAEWKQSGEEGDAPHRRVMSDLTMEAAAKHMTTGKIMVFVDELAMWLASFDRYDKASSGRAFFIQAFNGAPFVLTRKQSESSHIDCCSAVILGGMQPALLAKHAQNLSDDGLYQRFQMALLPPRRPSSRASAADALNLWRDTLRQVSLNFNSPHETYHPSEDAHAVFEQFEIAVIESASAMESESPAIAAWMNKQLGVTHRYALILHLLSGDRGDIITSDTYRRAIKLYHQYSLPNAVATMTLTLDQGDDLERDVCGLLLAQGVQRITEAWITKYSRPVRARASKDTRFVGRLLRKLETYGWLMQECVGKTAWLVNPKAHSTFAKRAEQERKTRKIAREALLQKFEEGEK